VEGRARQGNATKVFEFRNLYKQAIAIARFHLVSTSFMWNLSEKSSHSNIPFLPPFLSNSLNDASGAYPSLSLAIKEFLACHFEENC
jgi:hypothetical protein